MAPNSSASPLSTLRPYDARVVGEIARHIALPNPLERILETVGNPLAAFLTAGRKSENRLIGWSVGKIERWTESGLIGTLKIAQRFSGERLVRRALGRQGYELDDLTEARYLQLETLDRVANSFKLGSTLKLGAEGALLGAATTAAYIVPGSAFLAGSLIFADVTASMTLLSHQACRVAATYGFLLQDPAMFPHLIAAMAPRARSSNEGYVAAKTATLAAVREAALFAAGARGVIDRQLLEREAPHLVKLIVFVAERLGVVITEKNLAMLVPLAGAGLNSAVNVSFGRVGHSVAQDYFRRLILVQQYGQAMVEAALADELSLLRATASTRRQQTFSR